MKDIAVYMHIPFCDHRCDYCHFTSLVSSHLHRRYVEALLAEIDLYPEALKNPYTIYIGGGTPSALEEEDLEILLKGIALRLEGQPLEYTIEVNPESITREKLALCRRYGVNRLSMGVQSINNKVLKFLGRRSSRQKILAACDMIEESGFDHVSVDFIYGIDGISYDLRDIGELTKAYPWIDHLSLYPLEVYEDLPLAQRSQNDDDLAADDYDFLLEYLPNLGFFQYEVCNFAKASARAIHNSHYWKPGRYYGLGLSAHGYLEDYRYSNTTQIQTYLTAVEKGKAPITTKRKISGEEEIEEYLMLRLRTLEGIHVEDFNRRFQKDFFDLYGQAITKHIQRQNLILDQGWIRPSSKALFIIHQVLYDLIS